MMVKELPKNTDTHLVFIDDRCELACWNHYDHGEYRWFYDKEGYAMTKELSDSVTDWVSLDDLVALYHKTAVV